MHLLRKIWNGCLAKSSYAIFTGGIGRRARTTLCLIDARMGVIRNKDKNRGLY